MVTDYRRLDVQSVQGFLLDDPGFLREIVQRVLQEVLEAEMTEHVGASPYERVERRTGRRNGHKPRALRTRVVTLNLLVPQRRGLSGVELVVSDAHEGLKAAIARHFQGASHQRCQVHYARDLPGMVGVRRRKELAEGLRRVFAAPSREVVLGLPPS